MRIVVDTNVIVSALLTPEGNVASIIDLINDGTISVVYSSGMLDELIAVLRRLKISEKVINEYVELISIRGIWIRLRTKLVDNG